MKMVNKAFPAILALGLITAGSAGAVDLPDIIAPQDSAASKLPPLSSFISSFTGSSVASGAFDNNSASQSTGRPSYLAKYKGDSSLAQNFLLPSSDSYKNGLTN